MAAGKPIGSGEGLTADFAGMTKNQLYDIMSQMKTLIEQNKQQAREILIQNPLLTKALFQAQIMLGMVQPPPVIPNIQPTPSQQPQQSVQASQQSNIQATHLLARGLQDQSGTSQAQSMIRKHHQTQPSVPPSSASGSIPPINLPSQSMPSHLLQQAKGHSHPQVPSVAVPQASQLQNIPPTHQSTSQLPPLHQPQMPAVSSQLQQPVQTTAVPPIQLQPQMHSRLASMPSFHHQYGSQMVPNIGFQHTGVPQRSSQPMFHGQPPVPSQPPLQSHYQAGGPHMGIEFNDPVGSMTQSNRGSSWMSGPPDSSTVTHLPGQSLGSGPTVHSSQPAHQASLTPEMEQTLLQQVLSLTPEQINNLPPEQRHQVLQLQQILRQRNS